MALAPEVRVSQSGVQSVGTGAPDVRISQSGVLAIGIYPTEFVQVSQSGLQAVVSASTDVRVSQSGIMVVGRGRVADPVVRAWGFWMDQHWYYVLRLPTGYTLVYDTYADQWYIWGSGDSLTWRPIHGTNWLGAGPLQGTYGSNVVVGDDGNGSLYFLNPDSPTDDDTFQGAELPRPFLRQITGQVSVRNRNQVRCYGVEIMGSIGDSEIDLTDITLLTSDDMGHTYDDQGTVTVDAGDYTARVEWNTGLGSYTSPGRMFRIEDYGALQRIDWMEMRDGPDESEDG